MRWVQIHRKHFRHVDSLSCFQLLYQQNKSLLLRTMSSWYICCSVHILEYLVTHISTESLKEAEKQNTFLPLHINQLLLHLVHSVCFIIDPAIFT